ncbi:GntR family transcriptional regulator [Labrys monachus]|uniref:DNA-binding GntR family transcriptional regulator n=1 Tax=Labrys monachus TaxID=217067 RepID=A0ABU0FKJ8_9HYPH|nr:GntR family transcriptional regulator [Labrys monachus]MDQ0395046.1 DNA-binding GntR family transcriptional regulator [Labrys monachus]
MPDAGVKASSYAFLEPLGQSGRGGTTDRIQSLLREAIIGFDLAPGEDIDKLAICERLGVSRFPVSEALARLQGEGLVEILPQRGTRVSRIRLAEVRQSMFIRRALEAQTVRTLAESHDGALLPALERSLRYQKAAAAAADRHGFHALDLEFHQILLDALGFARVKTVVEAARANLDRVRRLLSSPRRHALTLAEHEQIVACLQAGDSETARLAMERHLDSVITELVSFAAENPTLFEDL